MEISKLNEIMLKWYKSTYRPMKLIQHIIEMIFSIHRSRISIKKIINYSNNLELSIKTRSFNVSIECTVLNELHWTAPLHHNPMQLCSKLTNVVVYECNHFFWLVREGEEDDAMLDLFNTNYLIKQENYSDSIIVVSLGLYVFSQPLKWYTFRMCKCKPAKNGEINAIYDHYCRKLPFFFAGLHLRIRNVYH